MDDTKFKIWCMDTKTWIKNEYGGYEFTMGDEHVGMPSYIYVQYIGMKDKRDVDVYGQDICKDSDGHLHRIFWGQFGVCAEYRAWDRDCGTVWTSCRLEKIPYWDLEVVGNVFENPELLED